jgi:hypothetical protein
MLELQHFADLSSISYSIAPKPGTFFCVRYLRQDMA